MSQEYSMGLQELARLPDVSAHNEPGALRAVIDYPFDDPGFFAGDDFTRVGELRSSG